MNEPRPWTKAENGQRHCLRHDVDFEATCPGCDKDPGPALDDYLDKPLVAIPPTGCMSSQQIERWFVALAKKSAADADALAAAYPLPAPAKAKKKHTGPFEVVELAAPELAGEKPRVRDFHDDVAIAKYRDVAIKAMRAAGALALRREDEDLVRRRARWMRDRSRGAAH